MLFRYYIELKNIWCGDYSILLNINIFSFFATLGGIGTLDLSFLGELGDINNLLQKNGYLDPVKGQPSIDPNHGAGSILTAS